MVNANDWYWFRQIYGGYWVRRRGIGWKPATKRHFEECVAHPRIWQCESVEDHSNNDGLFGVMFLALTVSTVLLLAALWGSV